ncbi:MAG: mandelate racemase/muconate lactonizing enzyme family protein [Dehalococcoidia bacterium]|nr:mandelate racemase/muconate lactonizing enzyme family protein [Dehalococcoidia bacterium]MSQ35081.1 mandelate racemase/muconate lactonizing enzyme family protein [Dehalococcoidia bacterium]
MKITGVKTTLYEIAMARPMGDANSPAGRKRSGGLTVEVTTDEGITGVAPSGPGARAQIQSMCEGLLVGEDPRHVTGLWQKMVGKVFKGGHEGIVNDAISTLDIALWDLKAKWNREPLWKTLGGARPKALGYASGLEMPLSDQQVFDWYSMMATKHGFKGGKLKVGVDQDMDLRRIGKMRDALAQVTPYPMLTVDANEYWSPKQAIRHVREMEEQFDIYWVEEPARRWDFLGLKRVRDAVKAQVCAGENLDTLGDFLGYFHNGSADIIQIHTGMTGLTCCLQIADAAAGFELPVHLGGSTGSWHAEVATAIPNFLIMEVGEPDAGPVWKSDVRIEDGYLIPGDQPGIGLEIDHEELEAHRVEKLSAVSGASPFGRRPGAGMYEVGVMDWERENAAKLTKGLKFK